MQVGEGGRRVLRCTPTVLMCLGKVKKLSK